MVLIVCLVLAVVAMVVSSPYQLTGASTALDSEEQAFLGLINQYRQTNGLGTLSIDANVEDASRWMSADMGANNYFSHTDSLGRDPFQRMCDFGYCYNTWKGENLAAGTSSAQTAFNLWKDSPGHNANMINANYKVIGIARAYTAGSAYGWYWTTDFGGYVAPPPAPTASPSPSPTASPSPSPTPGPNADSDGDGFTNGTEQALGTSATARCGNFDTTKPGSPSLNWPADLAAGTSANRVDLQDVTSFMSPVRRLNTSPGKAGFDLRWDLVPGNQIYQDQINILDLTTLITVRPPMFGGAKAYGGSACQ